MLFARKSEAAVFYPLNSRGNMELFRIVARRKRTASDACYTLFDNNGFDAVSESVPGFFVDYGIIEAVHIARTAYCKNTVFIKIPGCVIAAFKVD